MRLLQGRTGRIDVVYVAHLPSMAAFSPGAVAEMETDFDEVEQQLRTMAGEQLREHVADWDFERRQGLIAEEILAAAKDQVAAHPGSTVVDRGREFFPGRAPGRRLGRRRPGPALAGAPGGRAVAA